MPCDWLKGKTQFKRRFFPWNGVWNGIKQYDSKTIRKRYENAVLDKQIDVATVHDTLFQKLNLTQKHGKAI